MRAVFISDAHIRDRDDVNLPPLLGFLDYLSGSVERLFIVGDLFDTWFAFPHAVFEDYVPLLGALHALKRSGIGITYVTGNHDFEMGSFFTGALGADVHDTEMTLESDGRRAFIAHGDMVDEDDRKYRRLRRILRAKPTRWLGRRLPPSWVWRVGQMLTERYAGDEGEDRTRLIRVFADYAAARHDEGFDCVILGHLHHPVFAQSEGRDSVRTYVNLGDWIRWRTFLRWDNGETALKQWDPSGSVERDFSPPSD